MTTSLLVGLALIVGAPAPKDAKKDAPTVVGDWVSDSIIDRGDADPNPGKLTLTMTADGKLTIKEGKEEPEKLQYTVDSKKDPAEIDILEPVDNAVGNGMKTHTIPGIYKLEGDTLIICISHKNDRPKTFTSTKADRTVLITLKRIKKN
ncbi:MAG TPA: TIGR03067 domain-containing protein [Gemmataceae bacterium]|jgi:uncharacterized protein (TIGR03067 family)|nr:TIGR03067 domain-containing protein [Gemmataceae bacterium]